MTSGDFEHKNQQRWLEYERMVESVENGEKSPDAGQLPQKFRELCVDLSLAEARMYGPRITERLNSLVIRGYELIYRTRKGGWNQFIRFVSSGFPSAVRKEWRLLLLCSLVFWLPFIAMLVASRYDIRWAQAVLGPEGMSSMEDMYGGKEQQIAHLRDQYGSNFMMFCFYIYNNVGIDFRTFAGGMAAGVGTLFFLLFNGLFMGAAAGYVNQVGDPESFWTFVIGHSSYELIGMIISGMAGMRLGLSILNPGRLTRVKALVESAKQALPLIIGAGLLTTLAAVVEGFWSAQDIPSGVKYLFGATGWVLLTVYFLLAGRKGGACDSKR